MEELKQYATSDRQRDIIDAVIEHGSHSKAAKALGIAKSTVWYQLEAIKRAAAVQGYAPEHDLENTIDSAHILKGASTLYRYNNEDGKVLQWVKSDVKRDVLLQVMREIADELKSDIKPQKPIKQEKLARASELLNLHVWTDIHLGMRAWHEECGENWDLAIAEECILDTHSSLIAKSDNAKIGFLLQLGDALHYDGMLPVTPTSNHILDSDTRQQLMIRTAIRIFRTAINMMLTKYEKVILLHCQGNHDLTSAAWLQEWFNVLYENEPRIQVIVSPNPYYAYAHKRVLLAAHHGHKRVALKRVAETIYEQFRALHGTTDRTYIHTGHLHTDDHYFAQGKTKAERHQTLAPGDAFSAHGGWLSDRSMKVISYDETKEVGRVLEHPV